MSYFAKFLPVEGEIKDGDWTIDKNILSSPDRQLVQILKVDYPETNYKSGKTETGTYSSAGLDKLQKVKLFLCTNDIQVGDKIRSSSYIRVEKWPSGKPLHINGNSHDLSKKLEVKEFNTGEYGHDIMTVEGVLVFKGSAFKVIGEISKDAIWIKEGDVFEEEEVEVYRNPNFNDPDSMTSDEYNRARIRWKSYFGHPRFQDNEVFKINQVYIKVKCKNCLTFH